MTSNKIKHMRKTLAATVICQNMMSDITIVKHVNEDVIIEHIDPKMLIKMLD